MSLFSKKKSDIGYWVTVDFTPEAKEHSVGYNMNKKIYLYHNRFLVDIFNYSESKIKELKSKHIFIWNKTSGLEVPIESQFIPSTFHIQGRLQITKRV